LKDSYQAGKNGEKESDVFLKNHGFYRPSKKRRAKIKEQYKSAGISIKETAFDLVRKDDDASLPTLYELKTAGRNRIAAIGKNWKGLGFTLTESEEENALLLAGKYKFIFLDLKSERYKILSLSDFLNEQNARVYRTKSVFIKNL
jgi:hypothetical protein